MARKKNKLCPGCKSIFKGIGSATTCSARCRKRLQRARDLIETDASKLKTAAQEVVREVERAIEPAFASEGGYVSTTAATIQPPVQTTPTPNPTPPAAPSPKLPTWEADIPAKPLSTPSPPPAAPPSTLALEAAPLASPQITPPIEPSVPTQAPATAVPVRREPLSPSVTPAPVAPNPVAAPPKLATVATEHLNFTSNPFEVPAPNSIVTPLSSAANPAPIPTEPLVTTTDSLENTIPTIQTIAPTSPSTTPNNAFTSQFTPPLTNNQPTTPTSTPGSTFTSSSTSISTPPPPRSFRRPLLFAAAGIATLAILIGVGSFLLGNQSAQVKKGTTANITNTTNLANTTSSESIHFNRDTIIDGGHSLTATGKVLFQNDVNSTNALAVQDAASADVLVVDTTNHKVGINTAPNPDGATLQVNGDISATGNINANGVLRANGGIIASNLSSAGNLTAAGNLQANGGTSSLSNNGLTINNVLVCTFQGCVVKDATTDAQTLQGRNSAYFTNSSNQNAGTLSDARLSNNVALLDRNNQTFSGSNVFTAATTFNNNTLVKGDNPSLFQVQNGAGAQYLNVDSTSDTIAIGSNSSQHVLSVTAQTIIQSNNDGAGGPTLRVEGLNNLNSGIIASFQSAFNQDIGVLINVPSDQALQVQNGGNPALLLANTLTSRIAINQATAAYTLDVAGDINITTGSAYRINGVSICTSLGCTASSGSGSYIQNSTSLQTANFAIQSIASGSVAALIKGASGQSADLLQSQDSASNTVFSVGPSGNVLIQTPTNSTTAFQLLNNNATSHLIVGDTLNARVAIALPSASYTLDVGGDINTTTGLRVGGTLVCPTSSGCLAAAGSGSYIQNGTSLQSGNFSIQSTANGSIAASIRGASGQTADVLTLVSGDGGTNLASFGATGSTILRNSTDSTAAFQVQRNDTDVIFKADTTNNRFIVGNATAAASANSTLFVVDSASTVNAPTGVNGGIYYDTTTNKFRCFEGGVYVNCVNSTGGELAYNEFTNLVSITGTTEATANTIVTASSVSFDGFTPVIIEFYSPGANPDNGTAIKEMYFDIFDGSTSLGIVGDVVSPTAGYSRSVVHSARRITPSAGSHTFSIRGQVNAGTGSVYAGPGGAAQYSPGFIRITRADAVGGGGGSSTLQQTYMNSTSPELTLNSTQGALTLRDASSPIGANLLEVQNNAGTTDYFNVKTTGISTSGNISLSNTGNANKGLNLSMVVTSAVNANDLVAIDTNNAGQLTTTSTPGSTKVFGIATTTNTAGVAQPIVVSGVYQVTADTNAVNIGDFLVASSTAGQAVSSTSPSAGSVIGRALSAKAGGSSGLVWIQVTPGLGGGGGSTGGLQSYGLMESDFVDTSSSLPGNLGYSSQAVIGNYIYLFGGWNGTTYINTIYRAPISNPTSWSSVGSISPATNGLGNSCLAIIGGNIYLFSGTTSAGRVSSIFTASTSDPLTWSTSGNVVAGVENHSCAVIGNFVYIFGGYSGGTVSRRYIWRAPVSNPSSWTDTGANLPPANGVDNSNLAVIGNYVYLFGGEVSNGSTFSTSSAIWRAPVSDPVNGWVDTNKTLPSALQQSSLAIVGSYVYLFQGYNGSAYTNVIYRAPLNNPVSGWATTNSSVPVIGGKSHIVTVGNALYLLGGFNTGGTGAIANIYSAPIFTNSPDTTSNPSWKVAANTSSGGGSSTAGQLAYTEYSSNTSMDGSTQFDIVSAPTLNFDGSTPISIQYFAPYTSVASSAGSYIRIVLWDGSTELGYMCVNSNNGGSLVVPIAEPMNCIRQLTPTAGSHQYKIKAVGTASGTVATGSGGASNYLPGFIRITTANGTGGSAGSIANGTAVQTGNFNVQSAGAALVAATIQGAVGQTANLLNVLSGTGVNLFSIGPSGIITLGPASATPSILVLGNKNTSGDPTCTDGGVYYNSTSTQIRGCVNGAWNTVAGANTGTTIPTTNLYDGRTFRLRIGSTPYDFVNLVYDATYGRWVSDQSVLIQEKQSSVSGGAVDTTISSGVFWKPYITAGLVPQIRMTGMTNHSATSTNSELGWHAYHVSDYDYSAAVPNDYAEVQSPVYEQRAQTTAGQWVGYNIGWTNVTLPVTPKDILITRLYAGASAGGTLSYEATAWLRWVSQ